MYHTMPKKEDVNVRGSQRDDYIVAIHLLTDFLMKTVGQEAFFREIALTITNKAHEFLPASLPLGLGHGDLALRNIFVGENARVTVFDTLANWRTPIYKDIGYFLNDLKFSLLRVISQGFAFGPDQLMVYECAFLKGYFENNPIPYAEIRLYETFALLDRWSSAIAKSFQKQAFLKVVSRPRMILINRYSKRRIKSLLTELVKIRALLPERMAVSQGINKDCSVI
jgi:Ser/Thr protein kinase RdoA (MazF antagonist)